MPATTAASSLPLTVAGQAFPIALPIVPRGVVTSATGSEKSAACLAVWNTDGGATHTLDVWALWGN